MERIGSFLVCFDLGGVIVRICHSWEEACGRAGVSYDPAYDEPEALRRRRALEDAWQRGELTADDFFTGMASLSRRTTPSEVEKVHDAWILGEYPNMSRLIEALNRSGLITTACLSNTNRIHWKQMLESAGRRSFPGFLSLRIRLASHLLGMTKPSPEIYRRFEEVTASSGDRILFFDDLPDNLEIARGQGWRAHAVDPAGDPCTQILRFLEKDGIPLSGLGIPG